MLIASPGSSWTPKGVLVAHFPEHKGPINDIKMAPDHMFFASSSDDGCVKIWDTFRLYTNAVNRSRITYSGHGSPVKSIAFIEGRHSIASSSIKGQIHISRIEYIKQQKGIKYESYSPITAISLKDDYASIINHHETENASLLVYATRKGQINAIDLRSMKAAWTFEPPPHYGLLTSMVSDRNNTWIMVGTHRGVLALWDTRFSLMVKSWQHPSKSPINKLDLYPVPLQGKPNSISSKSVSMAVENFAQEISVWDIESLKCQQLWCVMGLENNNDHSSRINNFYDENFQVRFSLDSYRKRPFLFLLPMIY
jgi:phosphoinositide-3-kinase regulatory subunit 4